MSREARALRPPAGSAMDRSPAEVRSEGGWSVELEGAGRVWMTDLAAVRPGAFERIAGVWHLKARCFECRRLLFFRLEGSYEEETVDGRHHPASSFDPGMLSPAVVRIAQHVVCEKCADEKAREEETVGARDAARRRAKESGVPAGLAQVASWDSIIERGEDEAETDKRRVAIDACRVWSMERRPKRGVLLYGPPGSGKTRLAATAALGRLAHSPVTWVSVSKLMADLQAGWDDQDRKRALKVLTGKGALVLDDVDKLNDRSPMVTTALFAAIDVRDQAGATMIVTTNLKPSELKDHLGEAVMSRLAGICNLRPYPGVDHRLELS